MRFRRDDALATWNAFWFGRTSARNLAVARIALAGTALWIVLSRFDLPSVIEFPMWSDISLAARLRYFIGLPLLAERILFGVLHGTLVLAIAGVAPRATAFISALLMYHFAPFEALFWTTNPYLRGLTIPLLGLFALAFCVDTERATLRSNEEVSRWPVAMVQLVLAQMYFFAGYAKLVTSGLQWASGENMRRWLVLLDQTYGGGAMIGTQLAASPLAPGLIGWTALTFELIFPIALVSRTARRVLVPAALLFHLANIWIYHIVLQDIPLLIVFADWGRRAVTGSYNSSMPVSSDPVP